MRESLVAFESSTKIVVSEHKANNGETISKKVYKYSKFMSEYNINEWIDITAELIETLTKKMKSGTRIYSQMDSVVKEIIRITLKLLITNE